MAKAIKENISFEKSVSKLEEILDKLEQGDLPLEKSLKLYQQGMELSGQCAKLLDQAEQSVKIIQIHENGQSEESEFSLLNSVSDEVEQD